MAKSRSPKAKRSKAGTGATVGYEAHPEDPDEYRAQSIFWVPPEARWAHLKAQAKQPTVGRLVDDAMAGIERDNPVLKGVLPRDYARPPLDKTCLKPRRPDASVSAVHGRLRGIVGVRRRR